MTIRALHQTLRNAVMDRLRKLTADRGMAGVAEVRLRTLQQAALKPSSLIGTLGHLKKMWLC
jgi:hypothetical protein